MLYYSMGKASKKKRSPARAGKEGSSQELTSREAGPSHESGGEDRLVYEQASRLTGRQAVLFYKPSVHLLLIVAIGLLAYSNTFRSPFQLDEADFIVGNPIIRNLGYFTDISRAEGLPVYDGLKSRYVGYLTFALNYRFHGFDVVGYHMVNLAVHLANAVLVYFLVLLTFRTPYFLPPSSPLASRGEQRGTQLTAHCSLFTIHNSRFIALAVALLFVAHPIQTEAVTYVFQRFASLVSMFYLLSLVLYIKGRLSAKHPAVSSQQSEDLSSSPFSKGGAWGFVTLRQAWYVASFISAVLAMKTKENAFTLPVVIALYEFLFFSGPLKPRVLRLVPFLLTMLIVPLAIMSSGSTPGEIIGQVKDPVSMGFITPTPADYLFTQFRVIVTYIRLLFLPVNQNLDYDYPLYHSFFEPPVLLSFIFLAILFGGAVYLVNKSRSGMERPALGHELSAMTYLRLVAFGILWFFITLSVESGMIPIPMLIDEYRAYLPSAGFFLVVVTGMMFFVQRFLRGSAHKLWVGIALFAVIILGLASATYARNELWKDKIRLWEDVVSKSPGSSRACNNLGIAYYEKGRQGEAIRMYQRAIELNPFHLHAYMNLGISYAVTGRLDAAIEKFSAVAAKDPGNSAAYLNLGRAYSDLRRPDEAIENFRRAISVNPNSSTAFHGLGTAYARLGRLDDALAAFTRFVELSPHDPEALRNRGLVYMNKGDVDSARADFRQACSMGDREGCEYFERLR